MERGQEHHATEQGPKRLTVAAPNREEHARMQQDDGRQPR